VLVPVKPELYSVRNKSLRAQHLLVPLEFPFPFTGKNVLPPTPSRFPYEKVLGSHGITHMLPHGLHRYKPLFSSNSRS
jgi:hypothetical protein